MQIFGQESAKYALKQKLADTLVILPLDSEMSYLRWRSDTCEQVLLVFTGAEISALVFSSQFNLKFG